METFSLKSLIFCFSVSLGLDLTGEMPHNVLLSGLDGHICTCVLQQQGAQRKQAQAGYQGCVGDQPAAQRFRNGWVESGSLVAPCVSVGRVGRVLHGPLTVLLTRHLIRPPPPHASSLSISRC